jgi:hypothetical protein
MSHVIMLLLKEPGIKRCGRIKVSYFKLELKVVNVG